MESIISAAVMLEGDSIIASLPPPNRHHNILHGLHRVEYPGYILPQDQGFLTSTGRYVNRKEAVVIALSAGQITLPKKTNPQDELFSEDVW